MYKKKNAAGGLVLAGGAAIQLLAGIPAGWGAFGPGVEKDYTFSTGQTVLIFSCIITAFGIGCVLGGALQDRRGARPCALAGALCLGGGFFAASFFPAGQPLWLCLGFSLPVGLGCALLTPSVMSCAQKWYPKKRGFATGIIGGAGWPTFRFLLSQALRSPIGYAHSSAFLLSIVTFIGWRKCKK